MIDYIWGSWPKAPARRPVLATLITASIAMLLGFILAVFIQHAHALDQMWWNRADGSHGYVCVELIDPATGDFLQSAPADWVGGTAPVGEVRRLQNYAGTYSNTTNQASFVDEGTACVLLSGAAELQNETLIIKFRDSSGCPSACAYLPVPVYIQFGGNAAAYHDANQ